jgi:hypothetical protein
MNTVRFFHLVMALLLSLSFSTPAFAAGSCTALFQERLAKSGMSFSNDRNALVVNLTIDPGPYFGPSMKRAAKQHMPPVLWMGGHLLLKKVEPRKTVDFRYALVVGRVYTYVLKKSQLVIGQIPTEAKEFYSKHLVLSNHSRIYMAGELWIDADGTLNLSNASGSYMPPTERLPGLARFIKDQFFISDLRLFQFQLTGPSIPYEEREHEN